MTASSTVLVVDDEDQLLRLMVRVVERAGRPVVAADTASEARRLFREHAEEIGGVLLDVTMPDGEGAATLLPEFLGERPDLEVIVTSGDALPEALAVELERVGGQFIRKPFAPKALLRLLEGSGTPSARSAVGSESSGSEGIS